MSTIITILNYAIPGFFLGACLKYVRKFEHFAAAFTGSAIVYIAVVVILLSSGVEEDAGLNMSKIHKGAVVYQKSDASQWGITKISGIGDSAEFALKGVKGEKTVLLSELKSSFQLSDPRPMSEILDDILPGFHATCFLLVGFAWLFWLLIRLFNLDGGEKSNQVALVVCILPFVFFIFHHLIWVEGSFTGKMIGAFLAQLPFLIIAGILLGIKVSGEQKELEFTW